jgi:hypothetical protein
LPPKEMTTQQKRELIAFRIMGWRDENPLSSVPCWNTGDRSVIKREWHIENDLNLCAEAEANVLADPMRRARYVKLLTDLRPENYMIGEVPAVLARCWMIEAPAAARVDAMVALIQSMDEKA